MDDASMSLLRFPLLLLTIFISLLDWIIDTLEEFAPVLELIAVFIADEREGLELTSSPILIEAFKFSCTFFQSA